MLTDEIRKQIEFYRNGDDHPHYINRSICRYLEDLERKLQLSEDILEFAISTFGQWPDKWKTQKLCESFIKNHNGYMQYLPEKFRTYELFLTAIKNNSISLYGVPERFKTEEMCLAAVKKASQNLNFVPEKLRTYELCLMAVKKTARNLYFVPEELRTEEICLIAVKKDHSTLQYVKNQTLEIINIALEKHVRAANYIDTNVLPISEWKTEWFPYINDTERRRQFIRARGREIFKHLKCTIVDINFEYTLVTFKYQGLRSSDSKALIYRCPSSGDFYFTEIDFKIKTIEEGLKFLNNNISKEELAFES